MKKTSFNPVWILISFTFLFMSAANSFAQKSIMKFGKIEMEDMNMAAYAKDTNASALVLGEEGYSTYVYSEDRGWRLQTQVHKRIKIIDQRGVKHANDKIYLYSSGLNKMEVASFKGFTYNLVNGKIEKEKISSDAIFKEEIDDYRTSHNFTFPNVNPGSVLEYSYSVISDFLTPDRWIFQDEIPVVESQYTIEIPEFINIKEQSRGYESFQRKQDKLSRSFTYTYSSQIDPGISGGRSSGGIAQGEVLVTLINYHAKNMQAFISEPNMNSIGNYLTSVEFELMSFTPRYGLHKNFSNTWESVRKTVMEHENFGLQLKNTGFLDDDANIILTQSGSDMNKAMNAYDLVKTKMTWNKSIRFMTKNNLRAVYKEGIGNSAEINLLLVAMLRKVGLEANPVILSTRSNGIIMPGQIMLNQFNYVIAGVKLFNKTVLLDATDKNCPFNMLPERCLNGQGRIMSETFTDWVDLGAAQTYDNMIYAQTDLSAEGKLTALVSEVYKGYAAYEYRDKISRESSPDEFISKLEQLRKDTDITEFEIIDKDSIQKPIQFKYNADITEMITEAGDLIYFNPMLNSRIESNPYKLDNRKYPVDFIFPKNMKFIHNITIPDNYTVVELPSNANYSLPEKTIIFGYMILQTGKNISITCDLKINKPLFAYNEYAALKQLFENIVAKQAQQIVLKKIN